MARGSPVHLVTSLKADRERFFLQAVLLCEPLPSRHRPAPAPAGMVEKRLSSGGQLDAHEAADSRLGPDLVLQVANLPAQ